MSTSPPPAWYPDPTDANYQRWWDGSTWTAERIALPPPEPPKHQDTVSASVQPVPSPTRANPSAIFPHSDIQGAEEQPKNSFAHVNFSSSPSKIQAESTQAPLSQRATRALIGVCICSSLLTLTSWFLYATYNPENLDQELRDAQEHHNELVNEAASWQERVDRLGE